MYLLSKLDACIKRMDQEEITLKEYIEDNSVKSVTDIDVKAGVNRLIYNHAMNKTQIGKVCKVSAPTLNLYEKKLSEDGLINEPFIQGKSNMYSRFDIQAFMEAFEVPKYSHNFNPITLAILNHKGGIGKSTTVRTMATAMALDTTLNASVCILDLDPQGSCGFQGRPKEDDIYLTIADIVLRDADKNGPEAGKNSSAFYEYMEMYN